MLQLEINIILIVANTGMDKKYVKINGGHLWH